MSNKKKILITGGAGFVAGMLRSHWGDTYQLCLSDISPVEDLADHETYLKLDISQRDAFRDACDGMHTLVHLACDWAALG
jgi:uronate dehydrogenase